MGLFDKLYNTPTPEEFSLGNTLPPSGVTVAKPQDDLHRRLGEAIILALNPNATQRKTQGTDFSSLINALRKTPHLGIGGGEITANNPAGNSGDPFNSGFFQSAESRLADMTNRTGAYAPPIRYGEVQRPYVIPPIDPDLIEAVYGRRS